MINNSVFDIIKILFQYLLHAISAPRMEVIVDHDSIWGKNLPYLVGRIACRQVARQKISPLTHANERVGDSLIDGARPLLMQMANHLILLFQLCM